MVEDELDCFICFQRVGMSAKEILDLGDKLFGCKLLVTAFIDRDQRNGFLKLHHQLLARPLTRNFGIGFIPFHFTSSAGASPNCIFNASRAVSTLEVTVGSYCRQNGVRAGFNLNFGIINCEQHR